MRHWMEKLQHWFKGFMPHREPQISGETQRVLDKAEAAMRIARTLKEYRVQLILDGPKRVRRVNGRGHN